MILHVMRIRWCRAPNWRLFSVGASVNRWLDYVFYTWQIQQQNLLKSLHKNANVD